MIEAYHIQFKSTSELVASFGVFAFSAVTLKNIGCIGVDIVKDSILTISIRPSFLIFEALVDSIPNKPIQFDKFIKPPR